MLCSYCTLQCWNTSSQIYNHIKGQQFYGHSKHMLLWFDLNLPSDSFPPPLYLPSSLLLSIVLSHEYWAQHQIFIAHNTQSAMHTAHTHLRIHAQTSIWIFNKQTPRTLTLAHSVLRTSPHPFTHIRTAVHVIYMLQVKEPARTERPWKFNTQSVQQIHKQTHTQSHECVQVQTRHISFCAHTY